jgi:CysZ protein
LSLKPLTYIAFLMQSFGGLTLLGLSIPVLNLIVAPVAVIAATIYLYGADEPG